MDTKVCFLILSTFLLSINGMKVQFKDCGSQVGAINSVSVEPCLSQPCQLHKGQNYSIIVDFTSSETASVLHAEVYAKVMGIKVRFPLPNSNGCVNSNLSCPIKSGKSYVYKSTLPISSLYPSVGALVEWSLFDHVKGGNKLFCMMVFIKVV